MSALYHLQNPIEALSVQSLAKSSKFSESLKNPCHSLHCMEIQVVSLVPTSEKDTAIIVKSDQMKEYTNI